MRLPAPMLASLLLLTALAPVAGASSPGAHLAFSPSEGLRDLRPGEETPLLLTLQFELSGVACVAETRATVAISAETQGSLTATPSLDEVEFVIPAGSHVATPHRETRELTLLLAAPEDAQEGPASATLHARLRAIGTGCVMPSEGGEAATSFSVSLRILAPLPPESPVGAGGSAEGNETSEAGGNDTLASDGDATNETADPAPGDSNSTDSTNSTTPAPLPPEGGYIGDYQPEESIEEGSAATPLHGLALVLAGAGVAALAWGRKR